mmetsp:Transcript_35879/g.76558  ORF Transcript_35879/g.76558 Transcript_35879/m.76558 type:complete len:207 (-) Transcript_35879:182-802(-)
MLSAFPSKRRISSKCRSALSTSPTEAAAVINEVRLRDSKQSPNEASLLDQASPRPKSLRFAQLLSKTVATIESGSSPRRSMRKNHSSALENLSALTQASTRAVNEAPCASSPNVCTPMRNQRSQRTESPAFAQASSMFCHKRSSIAVPSSNASLSTSSALRCSPVRAQAVIAALCAGLKLVDVAAGMCACRGRACSACCCCCCSCL